MPPISPPSITLHCGAARWISGPATAPQASATTPWRVRVSPVRMSTKYSGPTNTSPCRTSGGSDSASSVADRGGDEAGHPVGQREADEPGQALLRAATPGSVACWPPIRSSPAGAPRHRSATCGRPGERSIGSSATVIGRKRAAVSATVITITTGADPAIDISSIASWPGSAKIVSVDRSAAHSGNCAAVGERAESQVAGGEHHRGHADRFAHRRPESGSGIGIAGRVDGAEGRGGRRQCVRRVTSPVRS